MRKNLFLVVIMAMLALPNSVFAKDWWKPGSWFSKKSRSTTVTGVVDSVAEGKVMFKTLDGQNLLLIGEKAASLGENRSVKIRVFGNVFKPDQKYPSGAVQVRTFKLLEQVEAAAEPVVEPAAEPVAEPEAYVEPEPVAEPVVEEPQADAPDTEEYAEPQATEEPAADQGVSQYVVKSGDTLGKISKALFGTSGQWKKIAEYNGITNPKLLKVGMTLRIPQQ
ncbi:MAG TPA: LysM peptidoglycan-binding domain-containing protein [Candidatus Rifleibacterium sp.]|nr:LysM peptidoglycan-binding domain-containing protein [Candidatus Rifleibacterium sp.]HPT45235.1 LysM peptidoglycan-binding domain-containing protein [Candidatus Rifleibacterium sp.]